MKRAVIPEGRVTPFHAFPGSQAGCDARRDPFPPGCTRGTDVPCGAGTFRNPGLAGPIRGGSP